MRLVYLAGLDPSSRQGHAVHTRHLVTALESRGHTVRLLCLRGRGVMPSPAGGVVAVDRSGPPGLRQLRTESAFAGALSRAVRELPADLVLIRQELFTLAPLLGRLPVPFVAEVNALTSEVLAINGGKSWKVALAARLEREVLRRAASVGVVSPRLRLLLTQRYGLAPHRIGLVPNGAWIPPIPSLEERRRDRSAFGIDAHEFLVLYFGNLNRLQGIELLLAALARPETAPVRALLVGDGIEERRVEAACARLGPTGRVRRVPGLEESELLRLAQAAQLLVAPYDPDVLARTGLDPLKVIQGLATGRPVLTTDHEDLRWVLGSRGEADAAIPPAGVLIPPRPDAWGAAIAQQRERWEVAGRPLADWPWSDQESPGRRLVQGERTWDRSAERWERILSAAVNCPAEPAPRWR